MERAPDAIRELEESETALAYEAMADLRPHWSETEFASQVERQRRQGYRLAAAFADATPVAVAGFRVVENLASSRHLHIDDLVTRRDQRSRGYGARLLEWLAEQARAEGCGAVHLDCGVQRQDAHRLLLRAGNAHRRLPLRARPGGCRARHARGDRR